ncbi:MAG TPA: hypothetical protein VG269_26985 [Tepidisphaeraceae bacterium]|jgi:hypothetical protein|nr:hypothetical protein [Tepidisphaeraceae bacterium]
MGKALYGGIGLACVGGFVWLIYVASQVPEQEQARRLTLLGARWGLPWRAGSHFRRAKAGEGAWSLTQEREEPPYRSRTRPEV